uniref:Uncharacterized protein n=1 Tax=Wuchereria bancrofti TaxID=6293 RepID=A0AAF5RWZ9_WUCBA
MEEWYLTNHLCFFCSYLLEDEEEQALAMTTVTVRGVSIRDGEMKGADGSTFLGVTIATALLSLPVII